LLVSSLFLSSGHGLTLEDINFSSMPAITEELISSINSNPAAQWTASTNSYFTDKSLSHVKILCGVNPGLFDQKKSSIEINAANLNSSNRLLGLSLDDSVLPQAKWPAEALSNLPAAFDARAIWGSICPSVQQIRDQGSCGSCWAASFASVASDRVCIASNGSRKSILATNDPLSCCGELCGSGCNGELNYLIVLISGILQSRVN
jgi:cathepsin B